MYAQVTVINHLLTYRQSKTNMLTHEWFGPSGLYYEGFIFVYDNTGSYRLCGNALSSL